MEDYLNRRIVKFTLEDLSVLGTKIVPSPSIKSIKFPAGLFINKTRKCFQHIARFRAGTIFKIPAKTGKDSNNSIAVTKIAHTNKGNFSHFYYTISIICGNFNLKLLKIP